MMIKTKSCFSILCHSQEEFWVGTWVFQVEGKKAMISYSSVHNAYMEGGVFVRPRITGKNSSMERPIPEPNRAGEFFKAHSQCLHLSIVVFISMSFVMLFVFFEFMFQNPQFFSPCTKYLCWEKDSGAGGCTLWVQLHA